MDVLSAKDQVDILLDKITIICENIRLLDMAIAHTEDLYMRDLYLSQFEQQSFIFEETAELLKLYLKDYLDARKEHNEPLDFSYSKLQKKLKEELN